MMVSTCEAIEKTALSLKIHWEMLFLRENSIIIHKRELRKTLCQILVKSINNKLHNVEYVIEKAIHTRCPTGLSDEILLKDTR